MVSCFEFKGIGSDLTTIYIRRCKKYDIEYKVDIAGNFAMNIKIFYNKKKFLDLD